MDVSTPQPTKQLHCETPLCFPIEAQPPGMLKALDLFQFRGC